MTTSMNEPENKTYTVTFSIIGVVQVHATNLEDAYGAVERMEFRDLAAHNAILLETNIADAYEAKEDTNA